MRRGSTGTASPENNTSYTANTIHGDGDSAGSGWYTVYKGSGTSATISGLIAERDYIVHVLEFNGSTGNEKYLTSSSTENPNSFTSEEFLGDEHFEGGDFDSFNWSFTGDGDWTIDSENNYEGSYCAKSGNISNNQTSTLQITLDILEDGDISFYRKVSSEACCDGLSFYIDDSLKETIKGNIDWTQSTWPVTAGERTFKWTYSKDGSVSSLLDSGFIDNIVFPTIAQNTPPDHTLTYTTGSNGSISGTATQTVKDGNDGSTIEAIPNTGYQFEQWSDGVTENPRTDTDIGYNITVEAEFAINQYTLTYNTGLYGSISGSKTQTINYGSDGSAVTAIPDAGYHFVEWSDGITENPRTDKNINDNKSVTAEFEVNSYTVEYSPGSKGDIEGELLQTVTYGGNTLEVRVIPELGYRFLKWSDNSVSNPRSDRSVDENISVIALYELIPSSTVTNDLTNNLSNRFQENTNSINQLADEEGSEEANNEKFEDINDNKNNNNTKELLGQILEKKKYKTNILLNENGEKLIERFIVRVEDNKGYPISNIKVVLHSDPIEIYTDKNGLAVFNNIPEGEHRVEVLHNDKTYKEQVNLKIPTQTNSELSKDGEVLSVEMDLLTITTQSKNNNTSLNWIAIIAGTTFMGFAGVVFIFISDKKKSN